MRPGFNPAPPSLWVFFNLARQPRRCCTFWSRVRSGLFSFFFFFLVKRNPNWMSQMARAEIRVQEAAAAADGSMTVSAWLLQCKQRQRGCCSANSVSVDVMVETVSVDATVQTADSTNCSRIIQSLCKLQKINCPLLNQMFSVGSFQTDV